MKPSIVVLFLSLVLTRRLPASNGEHKNLDDFAKCLAQKKIVMYGQFNCPHCKDQEQLFGDSFKYVSYVECRVNGRIAEECKVAGIRRTPTWVFPDGERREKVVPLEELAEKSGCALK